MSGSADPANNDPVPAVSGAESAASEAAPTVGAKAAETAVERALTFEGEQGPLYGILCQPALPPRAMMLIVAGQPQTRVGSHRMFVELARGLAARGIATLRFDVGGWGDSPGEARPFERSDRDIAAAAAVLLAAREAGADAPLWIWGLCDGASAAVLALPALRAGGTEPRGLCLVNPWVRSDASLSDAMVHTYYGRRLLSGEFWGRLLSGKIPFRHLLEGFGHLARRVSGAGAAATGAAATATAAPAPVDLPEQLLAALNDYGGRIVTVLSADDLTAGETESLIRRDRRWRKRIEREGTVVRVAGADHSFSNPAQWRDLIARVATLADAQD